MADDTTLGWDGAASAPLNFASQRFHELNASHALRRLVPLTHLGVATPGSAIGG